MVHVSRWQRLRGAGRQLSSGHRSGDPRSGSPCRAATNRNDWAAVEFDYLDFYGGTRHTAQAAMSLTVLYGYRDLSMTGFEEVPLMTECTFSASSTLNGQPRAGTQYDWTVDGEPRGDSAVAVLRLDAEGFYDVTVRARRIRSCTHKLAMGARVQRIPAL